MIATASLFPLAQAEATPAPLSAQEAETATRAIHARGDRIVSRFLLLHAALAFALAFVYGTWAVSAVTTAAALGMFAVSLWLLPGSALTRSIAGLAMQIFVALHIFQLHGLAEMHFFFFTGTTVLIVYQDARCFWLGAVAIIAQHFTFALLHNSGVEVFFFEQSYVGVLKLASHFGIVLGHTAICSYWALLLKRQTLASASQNAQLRAEMNERRHVQAALDEAQAHYSRVAANVPGMVYQFRRGVDGLFDFPYVSEGCRALFGVEPADAVRDVGRIFSRVHPEDFPSLQASIAASAAALAPCRWEGRLFVDHAEKWIRTSSRPAAQADGSILWDGFAVDATDTKTAECALRAAKEEAERANRAKSDFLSRMSHELRTPLNAILGFGQLLQRAQLSPRQSESVRHIVHGGNHLLRLINEVLEISRIEAGHLSLSLEPVEIEPLVNEALTLVAPLAQARNICLRVLVQQEAVRRFAMRADLQRLKQVLLNLLSNAIKYNSDGGIVTLTWDLAPAPAGAKEAAAPWLQLSVRDTGRGIPADKMAKLFNPFERLGAEKEAIEGTGIGLALSRGLVEAMGGHLSAESVAGQGSVFHVLLPAAGDPVGAAAPGATAPADSALSAQDPARAIQTVLHIEDNHANRSVIEHVMELRGGVNLVTATHGSMGLKMAREHRPNLILLDLNLPDISGAEVLSRLDADPRTACIPVIVLSADATRSQVERLLSLGACAYLTKPVDIGQLFELLDEFLCAGEAPVMAE